MNESHLPESNRNGLKSASLMVVAYQFAHGMWSFDPSAADVDKLKASINVAKRAPGSGSEKASLWIQTDFREFLTGRFGDGIVVETAIQALNAEHVWKVMQEIDD